MAEVNLCSWTERLQASEGLQPNSTAATLEYIRAWLDRLETRLVEHERRPAATLPPLRPEPDPPDGPPMYVAAQPPYQPPTSWPPQPSYYQPQPYVPPYQTMADLTTPNSTLQFNQPQPNLHHPLQNYQQQPLQPPKPYQKPPLQPPQTYQKLPLQPPQTYQKPPLQPPQTYQKPPLQPPQTYPSYTGGPTAYSGYVDYKRRIPQPPDPAPPYGAPTYGLSRAQTQMQDPIQPVGQPPYTEQPTNRRCPLPGDNRTAAPLPTAVIQPYRDCPMEDAVVHDEAIVVEEVQVKSCSEVMLLNLKSYGREFMKRSRSSLFLKSFGWIKFFSIIAFDPGGETSRLRVSLSLFVASWFPP